MASIATEIANAIHTHPDATVQMMISGITGILGAVVGAFGTLVVGWWRKRGSVSLVKTEFSGDLTDPHSLGILMAPYLGKKTAVLILNLNALILNTYQSYKSVNVEEIDLFKGRGWGARRLKTHYHNIESCTIGGQRGTDGHLPGENFTRIVIDGRWYYDGDDAKARLQEWDHIKLTLLIAPKKRVVLWHKARRDDDEGEVPAKEPVVINDRSKK